MTRGEEAEERSREEEGPELTCLLGSRHQTGSRAPTCSHNPVLPARQLGPQVPGGYWCEWCGHRWLGPLEGG